jgi:hypothetical protein
MFTNGATLRKLAVVLLCSACTVQPNLKKSTAFIDAANGAGLNGAGLNGAGLNGAGLNGAGLNGAGLNGAGLNGAGLNGAGLNGAGLNGAGLNGAGLNGAGLNGTTFTAALADGTPLSGFDFIGADFVGVLSDGNTLTLHVEDIQQADAPNTDVLLYYVSYQDATGAVYPLCGVDSTGAVIPAIPLSGWWNYDDGSHIDDSTKFTFSCKNKALGKCVILGYKPWQDGRADYHQACTRMVRADYCGNGVSWTVNGRWINLYDNIGIEEDTEDWTFEAEWDTNGARCISSTRILWPSFDQCVLDRMAASQSCGDSSHWASGTLLMNEYQTQGTP